MEIKRTNWEWIFEKCDSLFMGPADVIDMPKRAKMAMLNVSFMKSEWRSQTQKIYNRKQEQAMIK